MKIGPIDAVIAAAGSGARRGAGTPKAFVEVGGVPLLRSVLSTVESFGVGRTVVAVPAEGIERWTERVFEIAKRPLQVVAGGSTRQASVQACLDALQGITDVEQDGGDRIVMVHDGARPCASYDLWCRVAQAANTYGAAAQGFWWWIVPPGILIAVTGLAFVFIGNALDAIVNPKLKR